MAILCHLKCLKADIGRLQPYAKTLGGTGLWNAAVRGKAEVLLLIHKNLPCEVLAVDRDDEGSILIAKPKTSNREWVLSNVSAPNSPSKQFFQKLTSKIASFIHLPYQ